MGVHGFGDSYSGLHWFKVWGISGTDEEALDELSPGERIEVLSDDVMALSDVKSLAGRLGFRVVFSEKTEEQIRVVLERV